MLKDILENYELGEPWKFGEKSLAAVVPILRPRRLERDYVLLQEIQDKLKIEIKDTGLIGAAEVYNPTDYNVFVRKGTLLKGATQERGVATGIVLLPCSTEKIEVQCVHASRGIRAGSFFSAAASVAPRQVMKSLALRRGQSATWNAVNEATRSYMAMAASRPTQYPEQLAVSDDLVGVLEQTQKFRDDVENVLKKVPGDLNDQVGIAIIDLRGVVGLEIFNHPDSWSAFSKSVVRSYADILSEDGSELFEMKLDKVQEAVISFIQKLAEIPSDVVYKNERSITHALKGKEVAGEYTTLNTKMIHLIAFRIEEEDLQPERPIRPFIPSRERITEPRRTTVPPVPSYATIPAGPPSRGLIDDYFRRKGSFQLLSSLTDKNQTWKALEESIPLSTRTLAKRLGEAHSLNLIEPKTRLENGRKTYRLTPQGKKALQYAVES